MPPKDRRQLSQVPLPFSAAYIAPWFPTKSLSYKRVWRRRCVEHRLWVNRVSWKDRGWISICHWPAFLFHCTLLCLHDTAWLTSKNPFIFAEMTASTALKRWLLSFDGTVGMAECPESQGQGCQLFSICFSRTGSPLRTLNPHRILGDDWEGP